MFLCASILSNKSLIEEATNCLHGRFAGLFSLLGIPIDVSSQFNTLQYSSNIFLMTPALDPEYAFNWHQDHPGSSEDRDALRFKISGV